MQVTNIIKSLCFVIAVVLVGCANNEAFLKASSSIKNGEYEAFADLKKIVDENPKNIRYKNLYYKERELVITSLMKKAEAENRNDHWDAAREYYDEILVIDPYSPRGRAGLKAITLSESNANNIHEANELFKKHDLISAKEKLKWVLNQEPNNQKAITLLDTVNRQIVEENHYIYKVKSKFKQPINLEFKEARLKDVFEVLSKATGVNFVLDKSLKGDVKVSVYVKNTTIGHALNNIFSANQLSRKILDEQTVLVYPNSKKNEYEEVVAKTFYLKSVEPKKAKELLKTVLQLKDIFIDESMNILVVRDSLENIRMVDKLLRSYDIGEPEVLLEVEVLEISNTLATEIGLRWPNQASVSVAGAAGAGQLTLDEWKDLKSGITTVSINDPALILNLRASDGESILLANPRIRVGNHKKAKIHIGDRVPVITNTSTATGFVSESVSYLDVGLKLDVEPSITMDDEVSIKIALEVSNIVSEVITQSGSVSYRLGTRNAETTLRLKNGETQMLAGLINNEERRSADKVPGLSKLPLIGRLFSTNKNSNNSTEIVLLITPKIIRNLAIPHGADTSEFSLGTTTGNLNLEVLSNTQSLVPMVQQPVLPQLDQEEPMQVQTEVLRSSLPPPVELNALPTPPPLP